MNYIQVECFKAGGPPPSAYYADRLRAAFREVCVSYRGRRKLRRSELEPLWHFAETLATARLFGVSRELYDKIDGYVERMGRLQLLKLALRSFLTPALGDYMQALRGGKVAVKDAVLFYVRLTATYDWMEDNQAALHVWVDRDLDDLMRKFEQVVDENHQILLQLADHQSEIRVFWRSVLARVDRRFISREYMELAG